MIEHELLFLGLLRESPKHGYEIKRKIKEIVSLFFGVNVKSVYYPLAVLERQGMVTKRTTQSGKRPQRLVYELTEKGTERFHQLLDHSFLDFTRPQFSLDVSLYFLDQTSPETARRRLRGRIFILKRIAKGLKRLMRETEAKKKKPSAALFLILEHNLKMLEAEATFLAKLIESL